MNVQQELAPIWGVKPAATMYPLYPRISDDGVLALSDLNEFCAQLDPLLDTSATFLLDFSQVKIWDISAVLWFAIALQFYRAEGLSFRIRLPDSRNGTEAERNDLDRSADFLRKWRFDIALTHVGELDTILAQDQVDYFAKGPVRFYTDEVISRHPDGFVETCLSNRLLEIRDLTQEDSKTRKREISDAEIQRCIRRFHDAKIGNILFNNCEIGMEEADCFADSLVTESLLNIKQHPNATTGLIAIAVLGNSRELILAVADNGDSIARTILENYTQRHGGGPPPDSLASAPLQERAKIIHYATQPHVSRKPQQPMKTDEEVGLGLTYIKEDTVNKFRGKLRIVSESAQLIYSKSSELAPEQKEWPHRWKGNLLRISIPLKAGRN